MRTAESESNDRFVAELLQMKYDLNRNSSLLNGRKSDGTATSFKSCENDGIIIQADGLQPQPGNPALRVESPDGVEPLARAILVNSVECHPRPEDRRADP